MLRVYFLLNKNFEKPRPNHIAVASVKICENPVSNYHVILSTANSSCTCTYHVRIAEWMKKKM